MKTHAVLKFDSVLALDLRNIFYTIKNYLFGISKLKYIAYILSSHTILCTLLVSNQTAIILEQPKTIK